ncbi:MAG: phosphatidate cytidylyltransferase [Pirellulales bacterium]|nr:phosphatidate cytidylyltransferase [Pirellulales bacterium]
MKPLQMVFLALLIGVSFMLLAEKQETAMLALMGMVVGLLLLFSIVWRVMTLAQSAMAEEIRQRTVTWWWMVAVFMLALSTHRVVSFVFLGLLCFSALREYFGLLPREQSQGGAALSFKDRPAVLVGYLSIPLVILLAFAKWMELFLIFVPVYVFLLVPIVFVLQNRTQGSIKSMGLIMVGLMFFVYNLGHCLCMINMGPLVLMFCFTLTEVRDLLSFWVGKLFARASARLDSGALKNVLDRRVADRVSPNKTWSAGIVVAVLMAAISLVFVPLMPPFPEGRLSYGFCACIGLAIGVLGLFGDLVFSMIKRDVGTKDSGHLLPGHGGIIDRVDSLVFTIPVTFHLIYWRYF